MNEIKTEPTPTKALAPKQIIQAEELISQAIERNLPVENLERLLTFAKEIKAIQAKEAFDQAMARFQAECPVIEKNKKVSFLTNSGTTNYAYAPLETIVEQVKELLSKNGFSYTFDTEENEKGVTIFCFPKHILGHMEKSKCFIATDTNSRMNISQKSGSAISYGKRYAFCNAFGILTGDEDNDAQTGNNPTYPSKPLKSPNLAPSELVEDTNPIVLGNSYEIYLDKIKNSKDLRELNGYAENIKFLGKTIAASQKALLRSAYKAKLMEFQEIVIGQDTPL